jgi:hypothetical protein
MRRSSGIHVAKTLVLGAVGGNFWPNSVYCRQCDKNLAVPEVGVWALLNPVIDELHQSGAILVGGSASSVG